MTRKSKRHQWQHRALRCVGLGFLVLGTWLRISDLETRPMHLDEAIQADLLGRLLDDGDYEYNREDFHGPVLLYSALPVAWLNKATSHLALTEKVLRTVPVLYGIGLLVLILFARRFLGGFTWIPALALAAVTLPLVFYSRYFIMEIPMVFFVSVAMLFLACYARRSSWWAAIGFGVCGGLTHATKETGAISFFAMGAATALVYLWGRCRHEHLPKLHLKHLRHLSGGVAAGMLVSALCFTVLFRHPQGFVDSLTTYTSYFEGRPGAEEHFKPWYYYFQTLAWDRPHPRILWTEWGLVLFGLLGIIAAFVPTKGISETTRRVWRFLALYTIITAGIYALVSYKTPWSMLGWVYSLALLGGLGFESVWKWCRQPIARRTLAVLATAVLAWSLWTGVKQTRLGITRFRADSRNPYVYGHTTSDVLKLAQRVKALATLHPQGPYMPIRVYDPEGWPLPWYLRGFQGKNIRYAGKLPDTISSAAVLIINTEWESAALEKLGGGYDSHGYYGLRDGYLVTVIVENGLWQRYVDSVSQ